MADYIALCAVFAAVLLLPVWCLRLVRRLRLARRLARLVRHG